MAQVAAGDRRAFTTLFDRHQPSVARFTYRFVGDRARAEELTQDIFVKLFRHAKSYRPTARFQTFLFRVATNHCLNEVRRGEYRVPGRRGGSDGAPMDAQTDHDPEHDGVHDLPGAETPHDTLAGKELERAVGQALAEMSDRERAAFTMCRFEGMAYRDIADALSASEAAVKSLIHRATLAVAQTLSELQAGTLPARSAQ